MIPKALFPGPAQMTLSSGGTRHQQPMAGAQPAAGWGGAVMRGAELPTRGPASQSAEIILGRCTFPWALKSRSAESNWKGEKRLKKRLCLKHTLFSLTNSRIPASVEAEAIAETRALFFALAAEENTLFRLFLRALSAAFKPPLLARREQVTGSAPRAAAKQPLAQQPPHEPCPARTGGAPHLLHTVPSVLAQGPAPSPGCHLPLPDAGPEPRCPPRELWPFALSGETQN